MSGLVTRLALPEEYDAVDALVDAAYTHDYGPSDHTDDPMHRAAVRAERFDVWVTLDADAAADADAAGTAELLGSVTTRRAGGPPLHEDFAEELDLRLLAVSPAARRRGIGAAVMRHVLASAPAAGFDTVALKTAPNMVGAHRLYESLGFTRRPERDGLWIDGKKILDLFTYVSRAPQEGTPEAAA